jgi:hypothetical protein
MRRPVSADITLPCFGRCVCTILHCLRVGLVPQIRCKKSSQRSSPLGLGEVWRSPSSVANRGLQAICLAIL